MSVKLPRGIYRINTPVGLPDNGGFSFNQFIIAAAGF